jgi:hypothetical protein
LLSGDRIKFLSANFFAFSQKLLVEINENNAVSIFLARYIQKNIAFKLFSKSICPMDKLRLVQFTGLEMHGNTSLPKWSLWQKNLRHDLNGHEK